MGGNSTTWMNTAILVTCIRNFRKNRGPVSGILKGYVGLSTAIFTDLCSALFDDSPSKFLVMLSLAPLAICFTAMLFLRETPPSDTAAEVEEESRYFWLFNAVAVVVALYLLAFDFVPDPSKLLSRVFAALLLVLLASPLVIPAYAFFSTRSSNRLGSSDVEGAAATVPLLKQEIEPEPVAAADDVIPPAAADEEEEEKRRPNIGEEHTVLEAMWSLDFWILFVSFLCGVGTGLAVMNNMGQIGLALGYADVSIFVSLTSIWGFFGRIISGTVSEYFIRYVGFIPSSPPVLFYLLFNFFFFLCRRFVRANFCW